MLYRITVEVIMGRRDFGSIRQLPSGRYQARYADPTGRIHTRMFVAKGDAGRFLAGIRADLDRGEWFDPRAGREALASYAKRWVDARRVRGRPLAPRTVALYAWLLDKHVLPVLGRVQLRHLNPLLVREWHADLTGPAGPGAVTAAKCYRLLHAICNTALADREVPRNPCVIPGAGQEASPERPVATVPQVLALAEDVGERWRALVLLAAFCSLRFGELAALRRTELDPLHATVDVRASASDLKGGVRYVGPPKSDAGRRIVTIPDAILPPVVDHLERFAAPGPDGLVFIGPRGGVLREPNFVNDVWKKATKSVGVPYLHFHDLRHTGNTLAAATGASLRELRVRMGHSSPQAALRYQHATRDRDAAIAAALSDLVQQAQPAPRPLAPVDIARRRPEKLSRSGTSMARGASGDPSSRPKRASDQAKRRIAGQGELSFPS
ncbi:MAG: tyrosine-type recombinase/integrase [Mycobacteriales bacterium]